MKNQKGNPNQIKPNELRIGNIISCSDGTHHAVSKFGNYKVRLGRITNQHGVKCWITSNIEDVAPIPLTEELLLKCGFGRSKSFTASYLRYDASLLVVFPKECQEELFVKFNGLSFEHIGHLHQLQNLYFALTG